MPDHKRRQLLDAHKAQLKTIATAGSVWITRGLPPSAARPCYTLYDDAETVSIDSIHQAPRPQLRNLALVVTGWAVYDVNDTEKSEQRLDALALSIEQTVLAVAGEDDLQLQSTEKDLDESDPKSSSVTLRFNIVYRSTERNPI